jgi:acyl-[acyl-carrier protein] desaturase
VLFLGAMTTFETRSLLAQLNAVVEENLDRHLAVAEDWLPHEYVPWSEGRNFAFLGGEPWSVEQSKLSPIARTALEVNLLTEDNLPSYHAELTRTFGRDGAWGTWINRWTAEENRHAFCIRDYLLVTRGVDPEKLERARMATLQAGFDSGSKSLLHACVYASFQELATRVAHRNTGRCCQDPVAEKLLARVAMDENLHMIFYRNLVTAALEMSPSQTVRAIADEVAGFVMPGAVVPGFARKAVQIAQAGIYDLRVHHDDVIMPLLRFWRIFDTRGLDAEGEQARQDLAATLKALDERATRFKSRRAEAQAERPSALSGTSNDLPACSGSAGRKRDRVRRRMKSP